MGTMARCCPDRRAVAGGTCKQHVPRTLVLEIATGPPPPRCPHCLADPPGWQIGRDLCHCVYCGTWWERPMAVAGR